MAFKKMILSAALTGAATNRTHCPDIPYTPQELGLEAKRAVDAGAAIVHIHAREDNGMPSWRTEVFEEITKEVRKHCPDVIINYSTGAIGLSIEDRLKHLPATKPDMAAFNMGSMNYAIFSKRAKQFIWNGVFENSFDDMIKVVKMMNEHQICPEMECFDTGHIRNAEPLKEMGLLPENACYSLVMGVMGGIPATPENLLHQIKQVPEGAFWQSIVISRKQWQLSAIAAAMGGNFRVGLEDNFYLPNGDMAKSNGELVEAGASLARMIGREIASIEEAREMLNIPKKVKA
ncbi:3-keto-5-aminohexanoate cleavage protein [Aquimarina sp. MMG016]|uniref:3-keto-5-aminohexanoate cleavage protein n=1 Tax=Aquimarina sp. MMG016 TaxID=2822690 RepID=UPI001B3A6F23|nr:3-keto-5-aminohexanoate cleavage protein [Aquimarina sp. MMG016]MBQ4818990.1 3-keto-5-aminohexanoate cleavage protein [Aquimarina sp. MMG016]